MDEEVRRPAPKDWSSTLWGEDQSGDKVEKFFVELPAAVVAYSVAVGAFGIAAMILRVAAHLFFNI